MEDGEYGTKVARIMRKAVSNRGGRNISEVVCPKPPYREANVTHLLG